MSVQVRLTNSTERQKPETYIRRPSNTHRPPQNLLWQYILIAITLYLEALYIHTHCI